MMFFLKSSLFVSPLNFHKTFYVFFGGS